MFEFLLYNSILSHCAFSITLTTINTLSSLFQRLVKFTIFRRSYERFDDARYLALAPYVNSFSLLA